jgi:hypothetical protein
MTEVVLSANKALTSIASLKSGEGIFSTITGTDMESKKSILNALTNATPVSESLGTVINLRNIIVQAVTVNDAATGSPVDAVRIVLIDENGSSYACVSDGVMNSLRDIFAIMGDPSTWSEALPVAVKEAKGSVAGRKYFTLVIA